MRDISPDLAMIIEAGSFSVRFVADAFYGDDRTIVNLPVDPASVSAAWDVEQTTKFHGSLTVINQDDHGASLIPQEITDPLAPFGQEIALLAKFSFQSFTETVMLGRFRIDTVPSASDAWFGFQGRPLVSSSTVAVNLIDFLDDIARWGFRWPGVPTYTTSTWDELAYISGLPIAASLTDKATPADLVYQASQGGRLIAVQQLMSYLGGVAVVNSFGELSALPYAGGDPVLTLQMGPTGRILDIATTVDSTVLPNEVVGTYQDDAGDPIWAVATISSGPLAYGGPYPSTTVYDTDDTVTTPAAALTRVRAVLQQHLTAQTIRYTITCVFDPRAEIGDVVSVQGPQAVAADGTRSAPLFTFSARIVSIQVQGSTPTQMVVVVDVGAALEAQISVSLT